MKTLLMLALLLDPADELRMRELERSMRGPELAIALSDLALEALESTRPGDAEALQRMAHEIASAANDAAALSAATRVASEIARRRVPNDPFAAPALAEQSLRHARASGDADAIARAMLQAYLSGSGIDPVDSVTALLDRITKPAAVSRDAGRAANRYMRADRYVDSLRHGLLALSLARRSGEPDAEVSALLELGRTYFMQREFDLARLHHGRGAELAKAAGLTSLRAQHLHGIARAHQQAGDVPAAMRVIEEAESVAADASDAVRVGIRLTKASLFIRLGDQDRAGALLCGAIDDARRTGDRDVLSRAYQMSLHLATRQRRYPDFFAMLATAEVERSPDGPSYAELEASALWSMGLFDLAAHRYRQVIQAYEEARASVGDGIDSKAKLAAWASSVYLAEAEVLTLAGRTEEALLTVELIKAGTLRHIILSGAPRWQTAMSAAERAEESSVTRRIHDLKQQTLTTAVAEDLTAAHLELTELQSRMALRYPETDMDDVAPPRSLEDLMPKEPGVTVVEYVVRGTRTIIFTISNEAGRPRVSAHIVPIRSSELSERAGDLVQATASRDLRYSQSARDLHRLLIAPIAPLLRRSRVICIVPDGILWRVPFHALESDDGRPLIDQAPIVYAPSAALLALTMERRDAGSTAAGEFLGFATGGGARPSSVRALLRSALGFGALPDAEEEVRKVKSLYGTNSRVLIGRDASESKLKREASRYRVVHIAAHGVADEKSPLVSGLLVGRGARDDSEGEDGVLDAREILRIGLNADLTVLAACDTGGGMIRPAEGVMGLSWAVLATGCPTAVVSQRPASSKATAKLMVEFHRRLRTGDSPAVALQGAQRVLLRDPRTAHPFYWAAFVVMGAP